MAKRMTVSIKEDGERMYVLVDDEDYKKIICHNWHINYNKDGTPRQVHTASREYRKKGLCFIHHIIIGKPPEGMVVDHINRDPLDNRKENLRFVSYRTNMRNRRDYKKGIHLHKGGWHLRMSFKTEEHALGAFEVLEKYRLTLEGED